MALSGRQATDDESTGVQLNAPARTYPPRVPCVWMNEAHAGRAGSMVDRWTLQAGVRRDRSKNLITKALNRGE